MLRGGGSFRRSAHAICNIRRKPRAACPRPETDRVDHEALQDILKDKRRGSAELIWRELFGKGRYADMSGQDVENLFYALADLSLLA
jgi:hypothetical protein